MVRRKQPHVHVLSCPVLSYSAPLSYNQKPLCDAVGLWNKHSGLRTLKGFPRLSHIWQHEGPKESNDLTRNSDCWRGPTLSVEQEVWLPAYSNIVVNLVFHGI